MAHGESALLISEAICDWENAEVRSSGVIVNSYLDNYDIAIRGLKGGITHPDNFLAIKHESHVGNRLPNDWLAFEASMDTDISQEAKDKAAATLVFTPKMQLSGTWRSQCYVEAKDAADYMQRRLARPAGIDIERVVHGRLKKWLPDYDDFLDADITNEQLHAELSRVSKIGSRVVSEVSNRTGRGFDIGIEGSATAKILKTAQIEWASFVVDCITLFAKQRGGRLELVPFLEPKSISATPPPAVIYPFSAGFNGY